MVLYARKPSMPAQVGYGARFRGRSQRYADPSMLALTILLGMASGSSVPPDAGIHGTGRSAPTAAIEWGGTVRGTVRPQETSVKTRQALRNEQERMRLESLRILARIIAGHALAHPDHYAWDSTEHATGSPDWANTRARPTTRWREQALVDLVA